MGTPCIFGEDVIATLQKGDVLVENLAGGGTVNTALAYNNPTATFTFTGSAGGILPDGNYRATIAAGNVTDLAGNPLPGNVVLEFSVLAGDANRDGTVNALDHAILVQNYGLAGRTFSQGNFDYSPDGLVNLSDLVQLAPPGMVRDGPHWGWRAISEWCLRNHHPSLHRKKVRARGLFGGCCALTD